jgi:hypothetical protein
MQALSQRMPPASMHIESAPGLAGLSGMQVKRLLPLRSVRMCPLASIATIVAPLLIAGGPPRIALAINASSGGAFWPMAMTPLLSTNRVETAVKWVIRLQAFMVASGNNARRCPRFPIGSVGLARSAVNRGAYRVPKRWLVRPRVLRRGEAAVLSSLREL